MTDARQLPRDHLARQRHAALAISAHDATQAAVDRLTLTERNRVVATIVKRLGIPYDDARRALVMLEDVDELEADQ